MAAFIFLISVLFIIGRYVPDFTFKDTIKNNVITYSQIVDACELDILPPKLLGNKIECPPGTEERLKGMIIYLNEFDLKHDKAKRVYSR